jgi:hypothetical protein
MEARDHGKAAARDRKTALPFSCEWHYTPHKAMIREPAAA